MKELTKRQKQVFLFIAKYINNYLYPPTFREISEHFKISVKAAHDHVTALKKKNAITQNDKQSRTMSLMPEAREQFIDDLVKIPIVGTVAAGVPILSEENYEGTITLHRSMLKKNHSYFALKVRGDSMSGAGIIEGDIAVIDKQNVVNNGDIAVAVVDDAVTLKRFYKKKSMIQLKSENPKYKPITCYDVRILGRLSRVIRHY